MTTCMLKTIYYALIYSHISYGITSWGSATSKYMTKLKHCVKKSSKAITFNKNSNINTLKILNVNDIYHLESCKLIHDFHTNNLPLPLTDLFNKTLHNHNTRLVQNQGLELPIVNTSLGRNFLTFSAPKFWNDNCVNGHEESRSYFIKSLKEQLLEQI